MEKKGRSAISCVLWILAVYSAVMLLAPDLGDGTTVMGEDIAMAEEDIAVIEGDITMTGAVAFGYVDPKTAMPQMSPEVAEQIRRIEGGEPLWEVTGLQETVHCHALMGLKGIVAVDKETGDQVEEGGGVVLYVPNLISGLEMVSVLFYGRSTEEWEVIPADHVDYEDRTLSVCLPGAGVLTAIYQERK